MPQSRALAVNKILKQGCADERDLTMAEARGKIVREHMPENYTVRTYKSSVRSVSPASVGRVVTAAAAAEWILDPGGARYIKGIL